MNYLKYIPPEVVAEKARKVWASRNKTDEEIWQSLIRRGLIRILDDGSVKVCYEREPDHVEETPSPDHNKTKSKQHKGKGK